MGEQRYFIANFGEKYADEHPVDGGCYLVPSCFDAPKIIFEGNIMLLCCWGGHKGLFGGAAWGIGEVTHKKQQGGETAIYYNAKPCNEPIMRADIEACLSNGERRKFKMGAIYRACWLFEINPTSFQCTVRKGC